MFSCVVGGHFSSIFLCVLRLMESEVCAVLQMFALQGQGSCGLEVDLTDACTVLLFQAGDPGVCAVRQNSIGRIGDGWEYGLAGQEKRIMTRALRLSSWGWRSVREARREAPSAALQMEPSDEERRNLVKHLRQTDKPSLIHGVSRSLNRSCWWSKQVMRQCIETPSGNCHSILLC